MNLWTVVLRAIASANGNGEWPYMVRADCEERAIAKAVEVHKIKHPTRTIRQVQDVVQWPLGALG
jgi:hypothetical protein